MSFLPFIILVLLGLLAPSADAMSHQTSDVTANNIKRDPDRVLGKDLVARQGFPSDLLMQYDIRCALDRNKTAFAPTVRGTFLTAAYCKTWFDCKPDETKASKPKPYDPFKSGRKFGFQNKLWCEKWCECVLVDEPKLHYAANFDCPNPAGEMIPGNFGSVSRDTGSDGLVMEHLDGHPREE